MEVFNVCVVTPGYPLFYHDIEGAKPLGRQ